MGTPLVIFDLDGTLVHTAPDLVASVNHATAKAGLPPVSYADLTHRVGQGARAMIARAFELAGQPASPEQADWLLGEFMAFYETTMPGSSAPYKGAVAAIDRLSEAQFRLAVCTNKTETLARHLLQSLGLDHRFAAITGGDSFAFRKPDGRHVLETIKRAGGNADHAVMVGDTLTDIEAARNAGIPSIAVTFGYSDLEPGALGAGRVIDHFDALTVASIRDLL
jgi:phosphoglycolate phosphatase